MTTLNHTLTSGIWSEITSYLDVTDIAKLHRINKSFHQFLGNSSWLEEITYFKYIKDHYPLLFNRALRVNYSDTSLSLYDIQSLITYTHLFDFNSWKDLYQQFKKPHKIKCTNCLMELKGGYLDPYFPFVKDRSYQGFQNKELEDETIDDALSFFLQEQYLRVETENVWWYARLRPTLKVTKHISGCCGRNAEVACPHCERVLGMYFDDCIPYPRHVYMLERKNLIVE